ncbi:peptide/nickel transport system ATP-binding protein [Rathayibacter tanaceti]|uniref:Dipeptide ABC transporter ATP-binding protein n=2 Tax=Rathayibacter tanaceti TaxID=1671680 RepID=A0AAE6RL99_9MICO|nr:ABC transporter ATP-binding protein [Rathayibacter tanaceti]QHC55244.1 dipeptide ABC transporter ATP-binding protein [Rathayibacter tanaceti]TCO36463.1 peptide/nickel transport system ATP-binding protein [Rathayibacter tanaceti]
MSALVRLEGLSVAYGEQTVVHEVSLEIAPGEIVAVVGESGSGKSTTANAVLGLLPANGRITGGSIEIAGDDVTHASEKELRRLRGRVVGLVPQDPMVGLDPTLRIGAQVAEAVRLRGVDRRSVDAEVLEALRQAGIDDPELRARQYPHELSGGLRQRALIAIALAGKPRLIIADEPTSALDVTVQKRILDHLQSLVREQGIALLIITHDLAVAADRADRVLVMRAGRVLEQGPPAEILVAPREEYTRALIAAAPGLGRGRGRVVPRFEHVAPAPEILRIENVVKEFALPGRRGGGFRALDDVSFSVRAGQTLALVGESGSGKTTALRIALGLERASSGRVLVEGADLTAAREKQWRPLRRRIQLVHQNPFAALDPRFTVLESVIEPLVSFGVGDRVTRLARAHELLDRVGLPDSFLSRLPAELSGGQRQRVAIARALALGPDLVLLDEPVSALDVSVQAQILELLVELQRDLGVAYLFISHDLAVVAEVSHEIVVLNRGRVEEAGSTSRVFRSPEAEYTRTLLAAIPGAAAVVS